MGPAEFMERFGGACRTKNLLVLPARRREIARFAWDFGRGRITAVNRRPYGLRAPSGLPREFIRLHAWEAEYLFMVAARATVGIVEIGRLRRGSTFLLACANPDVPIWSIDLDPEDDDPLRRLFREHDVGTNVELLTRDSQRGAFPEITGYDLLFVDGDHGYAVARQIWSVTIPVSRPEVTSSCTTATTATPCRRPWSTSPTATRSRRSARPTTSPLTGRRRPVRSPTCASRAATSLERDPSLHLPAPREGRACPSPAPCFGLFGGRPGGCIVCARGLRSRSPQRCSSSRPSVSDRRQPVAGRPISWGARHTLPTPSALAEPHARQ
jgi:Methyltransferase domain